MAPDFTPTPASLSMATAICMAPLLMEAPAIRAWPTSWRLRMAHGRRRFSTISRCRMMVACPALVWCRTTREIYTARPVRAVPMAEVPVFELSPMGLDWNLTLLQSFDSLAKPYASLTMDAAGNLYGTTVSGGLFQQGNVFKLIQRAIPGPIPRCTTLPEAATEPCPTATSHWMQPATFMELRKAAAPTPAIVFLSAVAASSGRSSPERQCKSVRYLDFPYELWVALESSSWFRHMPQAAEQTGALDD